MSMRPTRLMPGSMLAPGNTGDGIVDIDDAPIECHHICLFLEELVAAKAASIRRR